MQLLPSVVAISLQEQRYDAFLTFIGLINGKKVVPTGIKVVAHPKKQIGVGNEYLS